MELEDCKASEGSSWIDWSSPTGFAKSIADEAEVSSLPKASEGSSWIDWSSPTGFAKSIADEAEVSSLPNASDTVAIATVNQPLGAKRTGKTRGLRAKKFAKKPNESFYDQKKPEEPPVLVLSSDSANSTPKSFAARFQYIDNPQPAEISSGGARVHTHVEETDEARKRFPNAKSISSAQFFGDQNKVNDMGTSVSLQKFSGSNAISSADLFGQHCDNSSVDVTATDPVEWFKLQAEQDFSSFKIMAGETWKKLSSHTSTLMSNLQERILR